MEPSFESISVVRLFHLYDNKFLKFTTSLMKQLFFYLLCGIFQLIINLYIQIAHVLCMYAYVEHTFNNLQREHFSFKISWNNQ